MSDIDQPATYNADTDTDHQSIQNSETVVVLRHIGGLSAGNMLGLHSGRYEFGPTIGQSGGLSSGKPSVVGFELRVDGQDEVVLIPRDVEVMVDGQMVTVPEPVTNGQVIQAGADYFSLGKPDDFVALAQRDRDQIKVSKVLAPDTRKVLPLGWLVLLIPLIVLGIVLAVMNRPLGFVLSALGVIAIVYIWRSRTKKNSQALARHESDIAKAKTRLTESLVDERNLVSRQCRAAHVSPTSLINNLSQVPERSSSQQIPVGLCDITWTPPVLDRDDAGWDYRCVVEEFSSLSGVPFLLPSGPDPILVEGDPEATAAVARYLERVTPSSESGTKSYRIIDSDDAPASPQSTIITIKENGLASAKSGSGEPLGAFVPHGIPKTGARITDADKPSLADQSDDAVIDLTDGATIDLTDSVNPLGLTGAGANLNTSTGMISTEGDKLRVRSSSRLANMAGVHLFTSDDRIESKQVLATLGIELADQRGADELSITILDAGDRGLIRLKQLPHCVEYAAIDDDKGARRAMAGLDTALVNSPDSIQVILVSEFPRLLAFLRLSGRQPLASQLVELAQRPGNGDLILLGSATTDGPFSEPPPSPIQDVALGVSRLQRENQQA